MSLSSPSFFSFGKVLLYILCRPLFSFVKFLSSVPLLASHDVLVLLLLILSISFIGISLLSVATSESRNSLSQKPSELALRKHALVIVGLLRNVKECLPSWYNLYLNVTVDIFVNVGSTGQVSTHEAATLNWLRALPNSHVTVEDFNFSQPASLPAEARSLIPNYPYAVNGLDTSAANLLASIFRRWRVKLALDTEQTLGGFEYVSVMMIRPDICPCNVSREQVLNLSDFNPMVPTLGAELDRVLRVGAGSTSGDFFAKPVHQQGIVQWFDWISLEKPQWMDDNLAIGGAEVMRWYMSVFENLENFCGLQGLRFHPETLQMAAIKLGLEAKAAYTRTSQELVVYRSPAVSYCLMKQGHICTLLWHPNPLMHVCDNV